MLIVSTNKFLCQFAEKDFFSEEQPDQIMPVLLVREERSVEVLADLSDITLSAKQP